MTRAGDRLPSLPRLRRDAHKGDRGRVLAVAGSRGMLGAPCLASTAALRAGAGLVYLAVPESLLDPASVKLTEVILKPMRETSEGTLAMGALSELETLAEECDAAALGPGLSTRPETVSVACRLYAAVRRPMVVDADALNALALSGANLADHAGPRILTPHPGEMGRLLGCAAAAVQRDRKGAARRLTRAARAVAVLKGSGTVVAEGRRLAVNATGNPGMATAGTGDVLTGLIAGLLAQGMRPYDAARLGAHLHGLAGDLAARDLGEHSLIAGDLLAFLPKAFLALRER